MIISEGKIEINDGWLRIVVESDLRKYLARLFEKTYFPKKLGAPSNGAHITIANVWELSALPTQKHEIYVGRTVGFFVEFVPYTNGNAIWIDVVSEEIINIRKELGLSLDYIPHLCLGYFKDGKVRKSN